MPVLSLVKIYGREQKQDGKAVIKTPKHEDAVQPF
jgi:hypothetical protein